MGKRGIMLAVVLSSLAAAAIGGSFAIATHEPADKVSAAGSETEVFSPNKAVTLLTEKVKTAKPTDLILGVSAECSIVTDVTTVGSETQEAEGKVRVWIEVDNSPYTTHVPVSNEDTDQGRVVFCNRLYQRTTSLGADDQNDAVRTFMNTRAANAFNWMALNVGAGVHTIKVKADLDVDSTLRASALAVVGNRTLIVEPVKSANDEAVTQLGN
jgi:hypothetical protein